MKDFSKIATPLTRLTQKNVRFNWNGSCGVCFADLEALSVRCDL